MLNPSPNEDIVDVDNNDKLLPSGPVLRPRGTSRWIFRVDPNTCILWPEFWNRVPESNPPPPPFILVPKEHVIVKDCVPYNEQDQAPILYCASISISIFTDVVEGQSPLSVSVRREQDQMLKIASKSHYRVDRAPALMRAFSDMVKAAAAARNNFGNGGPQRPLFPLKTNIEFTINLKKKVKRPPESIPIFNGKKIVLMLPVKLDK